MIEVTASYEGWSIVVSGIDSSDIEAIRCYLKRLNNTYPFLSWCLVESTTNLRTKHQAKIHIHTLLVSTAQFTDYLDDACNEFMNYLKKRRKKKVNIKQPKSLRIFDTQHFATYMIAQKDHMYTGGDLDWRKYVKT